jgi:hypothetical protein
LEKPPEWAKKWIREKYYKEGFPQSWKKLPEWAKRYQ